MLETALSLLFPLHCSACDAPTFDDGSAPSRLLCPDCREFLDEPAPTDCPLCGQPLWPGRSCLACRAEPPPWSSLQAAHLYGGPLLEALHACKYRPLPEAVPGLARLLVARLEQDPPAVDRVVGVPTHPARLRRRGFDLAAALAFEVALAFSLPVLSASLLRRGPVHAQVGASVARRRANVKGAFVPGPLARFLRGQRVLLVDDVLTTGATARAATRALLACGAREVHLAVVARADREL